MAENTKNRLTGMLLSKSRRARYIRTFVVLAACVAIAVAVALHQSGIAMTHEEQVLTCPVSGVVAHTHNESCYDANGNLVCTLPERELHTHTDDCYTEVRELTCGQEESETHKHTDACYSVMRDLTCGKEEITEEHVHGPGCFTTITVQDNEAAPESEANSVTETDAAASTNVAMPAQEFNEKILDDKGNLWANVSVKAPEGAFPANTTMKVEPLDAESVRTKVEDALKKDNALVSGAKQMKAVDIKFFDEQGKEIEPAVEVEVKITSDTVRDIKNPVLVHVDKDEAKEAEVLKKVDVVNKNEEDKSEDTKDTLKFESNSFSPYVIVEPKVISAKVITASGDAYTVTVSYGEEAMIPSDATLSVKEIAEGKEGYAEFANQTVEVVNADPMSVANLRMFDITILGADGNVLEPLAPVEVNIELEGSQITEDSELKVVHFANNGTKVIDPTTEAKDDASDTLTFTTDSFSVYSVINWQVTDIKNGDYAVVKVGSNGKGNVMKSQASGNNFVAESVTYDAANNTITTNGDNSIPTWNFTKNNNGTYSIKSGNKYLSVSNGSLSLSNKSQDLLIHEIGDGTIAIYDYTYVGWDYYYYNIVNYNNGAFGVSDSLGEGTHLTLAKVGKKVEPSTPATNGPHEVATVDSASMGITINMFDYPGTGTGANPKSDLDNYLKPDGWNASNPEIPTQNLASPTLNQNGYPTFVASNGSSNGAEIFDPLTAGKHKYYKGTANNLFLKSIYDSEGYFQYDSAENFAYYNPTSSSFKVYQELGSWNTTNDQYNKGGEFYPFFDLDMNRHSTNDPLKYGLKNANGGKVEQAEACYFGMTMDFSFIMPKDGKVNDKPMKYEFTGDDDVWIYIDGVLILDIGGRHMTSDGYIDFETGVVHVNAVNDTTIFQRFKDAKKLPDGSDWTNDTATLDKFFAKNNAGQYVTLKPSYTPHDFKMFYLEHYATASNLKMRFNLPPIPTGDVVIQKKLDDNTQEAYANKEFTFQLLSQGDNGDWTPVTVDSHDTFTLKPGESKSIKGLDLVKKYKIKELNVEADKFPRVSINGGDPITPQDGAVEWQPTENDQRIYALFMNESSEQNTNNLFITKKIANNQQTDDKFKFKILLENKAGQLVPYDGGTYYITKGDKYYKFDNGTLKESAKNQAKFAADSNGVTEAIPQDFTIVIEGLIAGTDFKVEEVELDSSNWKTPEKEVNNADQHEINDADGKIKFDADAQVIVTNRSNVVETNVSLKKVDNNGELLGDAKFKLLDKDKASLKEDITPGSSTESNPVSLGKLTEGTYYLVEDKAPDGYNILIKEVGFKVEKSGVVNFVSDYGQQVTMTGNAQEGYVITFKNTPGKELPQTGGIGTIAIYAAGAVLVGIAGFGLVSKKMRNNL